MKRRWASSAWRTGYISYDIFAKEPHIFPTSSRFVGQLWIYFIIQCLLHVMKNNRQVTPHGQYNPSTIMARRWVPRIGLKFTSSLLVSMKVITRYINMISLHGAATAIMRDNSRLRTSKVRTRVRSTFNSFRQRTLIIARVCLVSSGWREPGQVFDLSGYGTIQYHSPDSR